ncbi:MAG: DUF523 domain-containing protein [Clostridia bacterium]|nr:DUF523 domain-containing protein [Clostridia bacterium]
MKPLLISACLLGTPCRYDQKSKPVAAVEVLKDKYHLLPVCPECMGGLSTPREPCERVGERVCTKNGKDCTAAYRAGAEAVLALAKAQGCTLALLKARSPSCGLGEIYDGSFTKTLVPGNGVTAELLLKNGITVFNEHQTDALI